jgi:arginase family enzyme
MHNRVFGVPFDPPSSPERLDIKLAYIRHLLNTLRHEEGFADPYDSIYFEFQKGNILYDDITWLGKVPVDSWLKPKPSVTDMDLLKPVQVTSFLRNNGCWQHALRVAEFVSREILPHRPVMIGIDHSSTGGVLLALTSQYSDLNVIVLDAHFDVLKQNGLPPSFESLKRSRKQTFYHCGNFLSVLLEKGLINPTNLWILGVAEHSLYGPEPNAGTQAAPNREEDIRKWIDKGVHIVTDEMVSSGEFSLDLTGPSYLSIDMDVGSLASIFSARFMNSIGLKLPEFLDLLARVKNATIASSFPLVGMDIMEIDIHFLETIDLTSHQDFTKYILQRALETMLGKSQLRTAISPSADEHIS